MQITNKDFSHLGAEYQLQLINEILTDSKFAEKIIEIIEPSFFPREALAKLVLLIKRYYVKHEVAPSFSVLDTEVRLNTEDNDAFRDQLLETLQNIKSITDINYNVQETALEFCKLKRVTNVLNDIQGKLKKGTIDYNLIEAQIKDAITFKEDTEAFNFYNNVEDIFDEQFSEPIPTGLPELDRCLKNGGLNKGTLGLLIAPTGTGKTTLFTIFAVNAFLAGYNVLHIIFEDTVRQMKSKYLKSIYQASDEELLLIKDKVLEETKDLKNRPNKLHTIRYSSDGSTTPSILRKEIKKINAKNPKIDLVIIDYLDCMDVDYAQRSADVNHNEGRLIRSMESMASDENVALWAATQGGRSSVDKDTVGIEQIGGSIKKAQAAHVILTIAKTQSDRDQKTGNMFISKNRDGKDGVEFRGVIFDNERCKVDLGKTFSIDGFDKPINPTSASDHKKNTEQDTRAKAMAKYLLQKQEKEKQLKEFEETSSQIKVQAAI